MFWGGSFQTPGKHSFLNRGSCIRQVRFFPVGESHQSFNPMDQYYDDDLFLESHITELPWDPRPQYK